MGWRGKSQPAPDFGIVASEERDALLYSNPTPEDDYDSPPDTGISPATRRLATALGRFERQVAKAREGAPQELWSDECMSQLINAVEIAVAEGWEDVVEALTETGRVLQSYENEGQAHLCVPFLTESYEILSQMVSDLILGKIRSGLMQKWRNRYRMALEDLKDAGIRLVRDEDDRSARSAQKTAQKPRGQVREFKPESSPRIYPFELPTEDRAPSREPVETPRLEDYCLVDEPDSPETDEAARDAEVDALDAWEPVDGAEAAGPRAFEMPPLGDSLPPLAPLGGDLLSLGEPKLKISEEESGPVPSGLGGTAPDVIEKLDVLCERLSHMEREPDEDLTDAFATIEQTVVFLREEAAASGRAGCVDLCRAMARMCTRAYERGSLPEDKFFELAYAFCGVYVEADDEAENPMIQSWVAESENLLSEWDLAIISAEQPEEPEAEEWVEEAAPVAVEEEEIVDEAPVEVEEEVVPEEVFPEEELPETADEGPVEEMEAEAVDEAADEETPYFPPGYPAGEEPEAAEEVVVETVEVAVEAAAEPVEESPAAYLLEESPERLLQTAQRAMTEGRAAEAKNLALQAAAMMAQLEVEDAARRVEEAEKRLREGADLIESARSDVQRAEQHVTEAAQAVADTQRDLEERRAETEAVQQSLTQIEGAVEELDRQIRELQARREEEARRLAETRHALDDVRGRAAVAESDVASRNDQEQSARVQLEDARQRVKSLQRRRTEIEAAMERSREALTQRRLSLADIQQMLAQVSGKAPDREEPDTGEFLF